MKKIVLLFLSVVSSTLLFPVVDTTTLEIPYHSREITIDGKLNDWSDSFLTRFEDTLTILEPAGDHVLSSFYDEEFDYSKTYPPLSKNRVIVNSFWDSQKLYFAIIVYDRNLFAEVKASGDYPEIHLNDGVEIYIDTKCDSDTQMDINDYQFLIDILGQDVVFRGDKNLMGIDTITTPKETGQNVFYEHAVSFIGTLNDESSPDSVFIVELSIPFAAIGMKPEKGQLISLDICNNDIDYSIAGCLTIEDSAKVYWPFDWLGYSDFGYPEFWRKARLTGEPGWIETHLMKNRSWFLIYSIALILTITVIIILFVRIYMLRKMPDSREMEQAKTIYLQPVQDEDTLSANQKLLKKAGDYVSGNFSLNIKSEDLASAISVSLRKLQRITREELDCTPTNFIYVVKLTLAAEFLKNKKGNVSEAAYEFGFSDPSYFSKLFKKHFGKSPAEYIDKNDKIPENME